MDQAKERRCHLLHGVAERLIFLWWFAHDAGVVDGRSPARDAADVEDGEGRRRGIVSAQLVAMSRLNWRKHRLLQGSVALTLLSMLALAGAAGLRMGT